MAYDHVCGKKRGRTSKGDKWWWTDEVKVAITRRKDTYKGMCQNSTKENKNRYISIKNKAKKVE